MLYEKEHGLKRGRQRLRQLVQEGRLYEQEHQGPSNKIMENGLPRMGSDQLVRSLFHILERMVKPVYRDKIAHVLEVLGAETEKAGGA